MGDAIQKDQEYSPKYLKPQKHARHSGSSSPGHRILSAVGVVLCVLLAFLLICNLTIIIKGSLNPETVPSVFGKTPLAVLSGSMSGTQEGHIEVGDLIFIDKAEPEELAAGDVIAYLSGSTVVTHRIVEVQTAEDGTIQWITKGDANNATDSSPVNESQLVGRYIGRIPQLGNVVLFMQEPLGMAIGIGIPALACILYLLLSRRRDARQDAAKVSEMQAEIDRLKTTAGETGRPDEY